MWKPVTLSPELSFSRMYAIFPGTLLGAVMNDMSNGLPVRIMEGLSHPHML